MPLYPSVPFASPHPFGFSCPTLAPATRKVELKAQQESPVPWPPWNQLTQAETKNW